MKALLCLLAVAAAAQTHESNPFRTEGDAAEGRRLYSFYCVFCHGMDGASGRGARLASTYRRHGASDKEMFRVIANGVSGTEMSGHILPEDDIWRIVTFVRTLESSASASANACAQSPGDAGMGRTLLEGKGACLSCHSVSLDGRSRGSGRLGPDLTTIGATHSRAHLRESLVDPSKQISNRYRSVRAGGYFGLLLNEDEYTLHLIDTNENIRSLQKSALKGIERPTQSLMPAYGSLAPAELDALLSYLCSLRGGTQ